jgi:hypothetical protein
MRKKIALLLTLPLAAAALAVPGMSKNQNLSPNASPDRDLNVVVISESGFITLSADGLGTLDSAGLISVEKPSAGATVRSAFLASASTGGNGSYIADGCITLAGVAVNWDASSSNPYPFRNTWAEVTDIVAPILDAAPAGITDLTLTECNTLAIDGSALYVIFDDPATDIVRTAVIAFGAQNPAGDSFFIGFGAPVEIEAGTVIEMGLAISYGYQANSCQSSNITVNGTRITSSAGGNDDGDFANGALITVGGIGDDRSNPFDPWFECAGDYTFYDDELYNIASLVDSGDTGVIVNTANPSNNDNIFVAHLLIDFAAVIGEGAVLTPATALNCLGEEHTLTVSLQDELGDPVIGREVEIAILAGPHAGWSSGVLLTDGNGQASWTYAGIAEGTDVLIASFLNAAGEPQSSNQAFKTWERCTVDADDRPAGFRLAQNYPNPFNPETTIEFSLAETSMATLAVHDLAGRRVATLVEGLLERGTHSVVFDAGALPSGVYIYALTTGTGSLSQKMVLIK